MVLVLLIGGRWVAGKMTKKEIFLSASILVMLDLLRFMFAVFVEMPTALYVLLLRTANMSHWRQFLYHVFYQATENVYVGSFIGIFAPYFFVVFGKKGAILNMEKE